MNKTTKLVDVGDRRYRATLHDGAWRLFLLDAHGAVVDARHPSAFAITAGEAWARGVPAAAKLPIDELVIVDADPRGRVGHQLLSARCPVELLEP
jgi:hypothetical protein